MIIVKKHPFARVQRSRQALEWLGYRLLDCEPILPTSDGQTVYTFGRILQVLGLTVPPISLLSLGDRPVYLFASLGFAVSLFLLGRYIEGYAPR